MNYRVRLQPAAFDDLDEAYRFAAKHAPETAARWFNRFFVALESLQHNPHRCVLASENSKVNREIRQLLHGRRPNGFGVICTVEHHTVWVLRIRRASRRYLTRKELGE